jgi:hypothetical protein
VAELFRYIQQAFAVPDSTGIDTQNNNSDFQTSLRHAISGHESPDQIRALAGKFLDQNFPQGGDNPLKLRDQLLSFAKQLRTLASPSESTVGDLIKSVFNTNAQTLVRSDAFLHDKNLLNDTLISVKLVTGFDRVDSADLATQRQAIAFLEDFTAGNITTFTAAALQAVFQRPIRIPKLFVDALQPPSQSTPPPPPPPDGSSDRERAALVAQQQALRTAYARILSLQPHEFELKALPARGPVIAAPRAAADVPARGPGEPSASSAVASAPQALTVSAKVVESLPAQVRGTLQKFSIDVANTPVPSVIASIRKHWQTVSQQLAPYQIPAAAGVFRVGMNLFAIQPPAEPSSVNPATSLFRKAITRPVGIGDLQVVRQELIGYEAGEISHIENVLEGELLRRSTRRQEVNELITTEETDTTQVEERDQQSTSRSELANETQKEVSQQSTSVKDQTTTTDYGKLVENSKTNYAQSLTNRAVNTLTQMVKLQRVQREKKTFTEKAEHELDNRQNATKVRGIYQWVDKKYKARILNYGKRLLYDVVIPEPAAFFIDSLKNAVQPENFQLAKPVDPGITPSDLDPSNYSYYASQYGVTGSVTPPPDEFIQTVAYQNAVDVTGTLNAFGGNWFKKYYGAFPIQIPENTKAVSGYIQRTSVSFAPPTNDLLEVYIGENTFHRFSMPDILNLSFLMNGETGTIPVTISSSDQVIQLNFAVGLNCQRTDKAYEQWQLKTHAVIVSGYQRQLADYQSKLAQYQSAIKSQMALAQNFAHDPSIEQEELKKAFIFLLLAEHYPQAFHPTPNPEAVPPNPTAVRDWGAMVAFFERAFEWENIMYVYYPYFWGRQSRWGELILIQDIDPQFEAFLKAGAARVVIPARPGFEAALAHYQETGDIWMGEEIPDMFSDYYVSIIEEIKARNFAPGKEICIQEWDVKLPTTLIMLKDDATLPEWKPTMDCNPPADA